MAIRVIIADDDELIRDSLRMILALDEELSVAGTCSDGAEAFRLCGEVRADVVLMDIRMPVCDGIQGTRMIKAAFPDTKVLILTTFQDDEYIYQALKYGANGYMLKNTPSAKIKEQIKLVHGGTMLFHPEVAARLTEMINVSNERDLSGYDLSRREMEIIKLVAEGYSNFEISAKLFLSESTVKNYISSILDKLNLRDRTQLAIFYLKKQK